MTGSSLVRGPELVMRAAHRPVCAVDVRQRDETGRPCVPFLSFPFSFSFFIFFFFWEGGF